MESIFFEGTRDGLKKNFLLRQKWDVYNKMIHYKRLKDMKPVINNKVRPLK